MVGVVEVLHLLLEVLNVVSLRVDRLLHLSTEDVVSHFEFGLFGLCLSLLLGE
jgi:hypothetical protein